MYKVQKLRKRVETTDLNYCLTTQTKYNISELHNAYCIRRQHRSCFLVVGMDWVVVLVLVALVERIVHHLGVRVLVERVVRGVGTATSQRAGGNDRGSHNRSDDSSGDTGDDANEGAAVQRLVVASGSTSLRSIEVAERERAVVLAWAHNALLEALSIGWGGWVAVADVANVGQVGALHRAVVVVARATGRVTEIVGTPIVIVTQSRWQVLAASLITEISRAGIQIVAVHWRVDAD